MSATYASKGTTKTATTTAAEEEDYELWKRMIDRRRKDCQNIDKRCIEEIVHQAWEEDLRRNGEEEKDDALGKFEKVLLFHLRVINNEGKPAKDRRYSLDLVQSILRKVDQLTGRCQKPVPPAAAVVVAASTATTTVAASANPSRDSTIRENPVRENKRTRSTDSTASTVQVNNTNTKDNDTRFEAPIDRSNEKKKARLERWVSERGRIQNTSTNQPQAGSGITANSRNKDSLNNNVSDNESINTSNDSNSSRNVAKPMTVVPNSSNQDHRDGRSTGVNAFQPPVSQDERFRKQQHVSGQQDQQHDGQNFSNVAGRDSFKRPYRVYKTFDDCLYSDPHIVEKDVNTWGCSLCHSRLIGKDYTLSHFNGRKHNEKVISNSNARQDNSNRNNQNRQPNNTGGMPQNANNPQNRQEMFVNTWSSSNGVGQHSRSGLSPQDQTNQRQNTPQTQQDQNQQQRRASTHYDSRTHRSVSEGAATNHNSRSSMHNIEGNGGVSSTSTNNDSSYRSQERDIAYANSARTNNGRSQSLQAIPTETAKINSGGREGNAAVLPLSIQQGRSPLLNRHGSEGNANISKPPEKVGASGPPVARLSAAGPGNVANPVRPSTTANSTDNAKKSLDSRAQKNVLAMSAGQPVTCSVNEDIVIPTVTRSLKVRQKSVVRFRPLIIDSSRASQVGARLREWDPFWRNLKIISVGVTSPVTSLVPKPDSEKEYAIAHAAQDKLNNLLEHTELSSPDFSWGVKQRDRNVSLVLRMLPLDNSYYKKKRADCHLWPKGTFLQLNDKTIQIIQRKQQDHDLTQWKGMSNDIDLIEHIKEPKNKQILNIFTIDNDQYFFAVGICQHRSVDSLFLSLTDPASAERITRLSKEEGMRKALTFAENKMLCIDDSDDDNANKNQIGKFVFSLICPISKQPITDPVRGKNCKHYQCCDLKNYMASNVLVSGSRWRCASCESFVSLQDLEYCGLTHSLLEEFASVITPDRDRVELCSDRTYRLLAERKSRYKKPSAVHSSGNTSNSGSKQSQFTEVIDLL